MSMVFQVNLESFARYARILFLIECRKTAPRNQVKSMSSARHTPEIIVVRSRIVDRTG